MNSRRVAAAAVLLGFALGLVAGSWGQRAMFRRFMRRGPDAARMVKRLDRKLQLDESQRAAVLAALESRRPQLEALKKDTQSRFEALREATDADIRKVLRPDQQAKFDAMSAHWKQRMQERGEHDGPPGPPPAD